MSRRRLNKTTSHETTLDTGDFTRNSNMKLISIEKNIATISINNNRNDQEVNMHSIDMFVPITLKRDPLDLAIDYSLSPVSISNRQESDAADSTICLPLIIAILTIIGLLITWIAVVIYFKSNENMCDLKLAENRDFNKYYGLVHLKNHFTTSIADECDATIVYKSIIPQTILLPDRSASSFMMLAKYGTGKTLIRCEYFKTLNPKYYFKILLLNKEINEYIERFVTKLKMHGQDSEQENFLAEWTKNEFAQLLLSVLVTEFIKTYRHGDITLKDLSLVQKIQIITIVCFYYNGKDINELESFVNSFLTKSDNQAYKVNEVKFQIQERNIFQNNSLFTHFTKEMTRSRVVRQDNDKLYLLLSVLEDESFQQKSIGKMMYNNVFSDLSEFILFMKSHMKRNVVFIIDGIDESQYFFEPRSIHKKSLENFYLSTISQELLSMVMGKHFYLSLFYPKIEGINIQNGIIRNDKFPTYTIDWNSISLINYADYILQEMNKKASRYRCKSFTDFKTLVNYSNKQIAAIINDIPTPRALHYFMVMLISEMNHYEMDSQNPFVATLENVEKAYEKSKTNLYNNYIIKE